MPAIEESSTPSRRHGVVLGIFAVVICGLIAVAGYWAYQHRPYKGPTTQQRTLEYTRDIQQHKDAQLYALMSESYHQRPMAEVLSSSAAQTLRQQWPAGDPKVTQVSASSSAAETAATFSANGTSSVVYLHWVYENRGWYIDSVSFK